MTNDYVGYLREFSQVTSDEFLKAIRLFQEMEGAAKLPQEVVVRLQYLDIITQRIQHLIDAHEKVTVLYIAELLKDSFLRLQYFQFSIVAHDLFEAMSCIEHQLGSTNNGMAVSSGSHAPVFTNYRFLEVLAEKVKNALQAGAGNIRLIGMPALTARQISICRQLYTMEGERLVLDWYVGHSAGQFPELLKVYQSWLSDHDHTSIELSDYE